MTYFKESLSVTYFFKTNNKMKQFMQQLSRNLYFVHGKQFCHSNVSDLLKREPSFTFTCSKSAIEKMEKGVKYVQS